MEPTPIEQFFGVLANTIGDQLRRPVDPEGMLVTYFGSKVSDHGPGWVVVDGRDPFTVHIRRGDRDLCVNWHSVSFD